MFPGSFYRVAMDRLVAHTVIRALATVGRMTETADRYRAVAEGFTERAAAVPAGAWDSPAPCAGWVARDVVAHIVETSAFFLNRTGAGAPDGPAVEQDPLGAWTATRDAILAALEDPDVAGASYETPMGPSTFEQTVAMFGIGDILVHTWDLARAAGLDETLNGEEVARLLAAMEPMDDMMRGSGAFGPRVDVPADADAQTRLIAFTGRTP